MKSYYESQLFGFGERDDKRRRMVKVVSSLVSMIVTMCDCLVEG